MTMLPPDPLYCLKGTMGHVHSILIDQQRTSNVHRLYASTENGYVHIWDLNTNRLVFKQHLGESIQSLQFGSNRNTLITQEKQGSIKLWQWNNSEYQLSAQYNCYSGYCRVIVTKSDYLTVPQRHSVDIVTLDQLSLVRHLSVPTETAGQIMCLENVTTPNGNSYILAGYESGDLYMWNFETSQLQGHLKLRDYITAIVFDSWHGRVIVGNASDQLQVLSINWTTLEMTLKCEMTLTNAGCSCLRIQPNGRFFIVGCWSGHIRLYALRSLRPLAVLTEHTQHSISDIKFTTEIVPFWSSLIFAAAGGGDGTISLWNLYTSDKKDKQR